MVTDTWMSLEKTFGAPEGQRFKVSIRHVGIEHEGSYIPKTWVKVALLPNDGEDIEAFARRLEMSDYYHDLKKREPVIIANANIRRNGIDILSNFGSPPGKEIWDSGYAMEHLGRTLEAMGQTLDPQIAHEMKPYLDENLTIQAQIAANKIFIYTGGRKSFGPQGTQPR